MLRLLEGSPRQLLKFIVVTACVLITVKLYLAANLDLSGGEAYFWKSSKKLDVGFSNLPVMTALLVRAGTSLAGDTPLGVRLVFLLLSVAIPGAVYWLGHPVVGRLESRPGTRSRWTSLLSSDPPFSAPHPSRGGSHPWRREPEREGLQVSRSDSPTSSAPCEPTASSDLRRRRPNSGSR